MNPKATPPRRLHAALISTTLLLGAVVSGCSTPQPVSSAAVQSFDQAAAQAADGLAAQLQALPEFLSFLETRRVVVLDPMIEAGSGQQTKATQALQIKVVERLRAKHGNAVDIVPFSADNVGKAGYLLTGTATRKVGVPSSPLKIDLALTDLGNGKVVAQSSAMARADGVDNTPLMLDQDSPVLAPDKVLEGYARTTVTPPGQGADPYYLERVAVSPLIEEAVVFYNAGRYADALARFESAGKMPGGEQLRVLSGIYLTLTKTGRTADAEAAFRKIVVYGVATKQLSVKFLFTPGSTAFWPDPAVSGPYAMWMGEIAQVSTTANICMDVVGHTSRTGSQAVNDALSLDRAKSIQGQLAAQSAVLGQRTKTSGKGYRENIIGSGSDDLVDSLDRRVEFKVIDCT